MTDEIDIKDIFSSTHSDINSNTHINNQFKHYYECMNEIKSCDNKIDHQYFLTTLLSDKKIQKTLTDILYNKFYDNNFS